MDGRRTTALGALLMGIAVVLGAFGAHGLRARLSPDLLDHQERVTHATLGIPRDVPLDVAHPAGGNVIPVQPAVIA